MADFVLDGSLALAWCFTDEATPFTESIKHALEIGSICVVPPIWPSEVANGIHMAERRGRISADVGKTYLSLLLQYPIEVAIMPPTIIFQEVLPLARQYGLTVYDASYLNLALQRGLPLASLDNDLRKATEKAGGTLLQDR